MSYYEDVENEIISDKVIDDQLPFIMVPEAIVDNLGRKLGACGIAVYLAIKMHSHQDTKTAFVLTKNIAKMLDMGESTVSRELKKLVDMGLITRQKRFNKSSIFRVLNIGQSLNRERILSNEVRSLPNRIQCQNSLPNRDIKRTINTKETVLKREDESTSLFGKNESELTDSSGLQKEQILPPWVPVWLPMEPWQAYRQMRIKIRKPMTPYAEKLAVKKLEQLRAEGQDPQAVIEQSIMNSWQGLFPVRGDENGKQQPKSFDRLKIEGIRRTAQEFAQRNGLGSPNSIGCSSPQGDNPRADRALVQHDDELEDRTEDF